MKGKEFIKGDRIWHKNMGYGTVTVDTYHTIEHTTWTCVKYDDFLGQKHSLCGETEELILVERYCTNERGIEMRERMCGVCNKEVPVEHTQIAKREENGTITPYHMSCEYYAGGLKPCEDCGEHRRLCADCGEPPFDD